MGGLRMLLGGSWDQVKLFKHRGKFRSPGLEDVAAFQFVAEFFLAGEDEALFGGEELLALAEDGVADEGVVLVGAEDDAEGGVVITNGVRFRISTNT